MTSLYGIALLAIQLEAPEQSAQLLGALQAAEQTGIVVLTPALAANLRKLQERAQSQLGESGYAAQHERGRQLSFNQAIARALQV